jgi:DnaA family protein
MGDPAHEARPARRSRRMAEFQPDWDALILDDVDCYTAAQQHQAFNWFVNALTPLSGRARPVLAAGSLPPADLPLREDLRSRLAWGEVHPLHVLGESAVRQALQRRARAKGLTLSEDVLRYVLTRFSRDTGSLMQLLDHLDRYALQTQRAITVPLLKAMLSDE